MLVAAPVGTSIDMATTNNTPVRLAITAHHGVEIVLGQVFILAKDLHAVQGLHLHNIVGWWRGAVWMAYRQAKRLSVNCRILFQSSLDNVPLQRRKIPLHLQCWVVGGLCVCVCVCVSGAKLPTPTMLAMHTLFFSRGLSWAVVAFRTNTEYAPSSSGWSS